MFKSVLIVAAVLASCVTSYGQNPAMVVDKEKKSITISCTIAPRKLDYLNEIYPIEVIACWPHPAGKKAHETVVAVDKSVKASEVHKVLESFGLKAGKPAKGETEAATGPELKVFLEFPGADGAPRREPIEKTIIDKKSGKTLPPLKFYFTGSAMSQPNPDKDEKVYAADDSGSFICVFPVTDQVLIQTSLIGKDMSLLKLETNKKLLPPEGTAAKLIIEVK